MAAAKAAAAAWASTPEGVEARLLSEPFFIREVWRKKIDWLRANREARHINDFLMGTVKKSLLRLDVVRSKQGVAIDINSELAAYWHGRWQRLADFTKREALSAAHEIANRLAEMLETECAALGLTAEGMSVEELDWIYCTWAEKCWPFALCLLHGPRRGNEIGSLPPFCACARRTGGAVKSGVFAVTGAKTSCVQSAQFIARPTPM